MAKKADVVADAQNRWTEIKFENIDTKAKKTTMGSAYNGGNIGVQFEISATFRGKKVKPAIVMADGESASPGEFVMFTTNGEGWQHIGEWKKLLDQPPLFLMNHKILRTFWDLHLNIIILTLIKFVDLLKLGQKRNQ